MLRAYKYNIVYVIFSNTRIFKVAINLDFQYVFHNNDDDDAAVDAAVDDDVWTLISGEFILYL